jgi:hypothetical protein
MKIGLGMGSSSAGIAGQADVSEEHRFIALLGRAMAEIKKARH